ncbi:porin, partial [Escherichia coli]|uniref:porin n=2 Tax=Escherichia coli TaxID=562 RepID=UPI0020231B16
MKRKVLAMLVPALLVAGAANAAEIYNKNGNKVELYGKMVGERILTDRENGEKGDNSQDTSYARVGVKGETQINPELTGYGQFELDLEASNRHNPDQTRLAYAGLSYKDFGSFDYGRNVGVAYDAEAFTDMFVEWGGDSWAGTDLFMTNRTNGVATYRNTDFFGMVEGLNFALQYQGKNEGTGNYKANGDGHGLSATYTIDGFSFAGAYANSDRTDWQSGDGKGERAEVWALSTKYDANNVYAAGFAPIFPDTCYHLTHHWPTAADIPV